MSGITFSGTAYHGSGTHFTEFSTRHARILNDYFGGGIAYFTDNKLVAESYARSMSSKTKTPYIYEVRLELKNIFDEDRIYTGEELKTFLTKIDMDSFARGSGMLTLGGTDKYDVYYDLKNGKAKLTGKQVFKGLSHGMIYTAKTREILKSLGYDGLRYNGGKMIPGSKLHNVFLAYYVDSITIKEVHKMSTEKPKKTLKEYTGELSPLPKPDKFNLTRSQMPQIRSVFHGQFIDWLRKKGIVVSMEHNQVNTLRPTQKDLDPIKVKKFVHSSTFDIDSNPMIISRDSFILDGHHRWAGQFLRDPTLPAKTIRVNLNIGDLIAMAKEFSQTSYKQIHESSFL